MAHQINLYKNNKLSNSQKGIDIILEFISQKKQNVEWNDKLESAFYCSKKTLEDLYTFLDFENFTELRDAYNCGRLMVFLEKNLWNFDFDKDILSIGWSH